MRAQECKDWMKERGYLERWILPTDDLYDDYPELKTKFGGAPLGNSPEFNPWDLRLNNDVHICHDNHVIITKNLTEDNELNFRVQAQNKYCGLTYG